MSAYRLGFDVGLPSDARGSNSGRGSSAGITFTAVLATLFSALALSLVVYVASRGRRRIAAVVIRVGQATPLAGYASARSFFGARARGPQIICPWPSVRRRPSAKRST